MQKSNCFELGYIVKSHGLDGKVQAFFDVEDPSLYSNIDSVFLEQKGSLVPYFIQNIVTFDGERFLIKFEDINHKDEGILLKGCKLFLPLTMLPELEDDTFYFHDVIGFEVSDVQKGAIGVVKEFVDAGPQTIMIVTLGEKEILIPFHDDFFKEIDHNKKAITMDLPNGLIDLYLKD